MKSLSVVLLIISLSVSLGYSNHHRNDNDDDDDDDDDDDEGHADDIVMKSTKANQFLNRPKRHLSHECYKEGCKFEEVEEHTSSRENALEYWYRYRCYRYRQYCYNGDWGEWSSWESCTASCSNNVNKGGIQRRHRSCSSRLPLRCSGVSVQWRPCSPRPIDCNECHLNNGGCEQICVNTKGSYRCECKSQFYLAKNKRSCKSCPAHRIPRCLEAVCDEGGSNVYCIQCQGVFDCEGKSFQTYRAINGKCEELCSWRYSWCYPGRCTTGPTSCQCLEGFAGLRCQTIVKKPEFSRCNVRAETSGSLHQTASCKQPLTKYIAFKPTVFVIDFEVFLGVDLDSKIVDKNVPYILEAQVGITNTMITVKKLDAKESLTKVITFDSVNCSAQISASKPQVGPITCHLIVDASKLNGIADGQSIQVVFQAFTGGFITVLNPETANNFTDYYISSNNTQSSLLKLDFTPPDHCSVVRNCSIPVFDITSGNLKSGHILFELNGWEDRDNSDVPLKYYYRLYELVETNTGEMEEMLYPLEKGDTSRIHLDLNAYHNISTFSLVVSVFDEAFNERRARAVLLRFNKQKILINPKKTIKIISAEKETDFFWQTSLTQVKAVWNRHFYIERNSTVNILTYDGVDREYDFTFRGFSESISVKPELKYAYAWTTGKKSTQPPFDKFISTPRASMRIPVSLRNGDVVTVWVKAENAIGQSVVDYARVHVDTSPPVIDKVKLVKGENGLFNIENTIETPNLQLFVDVWDPQSGIQEMSWSLGERRDSDKLGYEKNTVNQDMGITPPEMSCVLTASICPRLSMKFNLDDIPELQKNNGKGLILTIRATNHALMKSVYYYKIGEKVKAGKRQAQVDEI